MTEITFLKSAYQLQAPDHYQSYGDFFRFAELAGFPIRPVDSLDIREQGVFITSPVNGDLREHLESQAGKPRGAYIICWQLERPSGSGGVGQYSRSNRNLVYGIREDGTMSPVRYADEVWFSDRRLALEASGGSDPGMRYVTLGSHPDFGEPGKAKKWDLAHMSYENPRRQSILKHFAKERIAPNCWPPERDEVLAASRVGLATHQDQYPFMEPLRLAIFAAYGLSILSETLLDNFPYGDDLATAQFGDLVDAAKSMLDNYESRWRKSGLALRERMCGEFEFGKMVREAVRQSVGEWR